MFNKIYEKLGLHQELRIIYVVDGYLATLYRDDECITKIAEAKGRTITLALSKLNNNINE